MNDLCLLDSLVLAFSRLGWQPCFSLALCVKTWAFLCFQMALVLLCAPAIVFPGDLMDVC